MHIQYFFKQMDSSPALSNYTSDKISSFENLLGTDHPIKVRFISHHDRHKIHLSCHAIDHSPIEVSVQAPDMYEAVDLAMDKLHRSLRRKKDKIHKRRTSFTARELHSKAMQRELSERVHSWAIDAEYVIRTA